MDVFDLVPVDTLIRTALAEDIGAGDLTSRLTVAPEAQGRGEITVKEALVVAGMPLVRKICEAAGGGVNVQELAMDGARVMSGDGLAVLKGPARKLLATERLILNLLQHLSGIATLTSRFVTAVAGCGCRIVDTRKTIPGLRTLEKYAVRVGGGFNHRHRLDDGILIKNNHITAAGGIGAAVLAARVGAPHGLKIEVECSTLGEVNEALTARADILLLDNMAVETMAEAVRRISGRAVVEASGGIDLDNVRAVAEAGVDIISIGALTHSAPAVDIHMTLFLE